MSFTDYTDDLIRGIDEKISAALVAMGITAVELIKSQMMTGYGAPIWDTGNLIGSITADNPQGDSISVGTNVEYAHFVHDGTYKMAARPFARDALENENASAAIAEVAAEQLKI